MRKVWLTSIAVAVLFSMSARMQETTGGLEAVARSMGAMNLNSIQYAGSGSVFGFQQAYSPGGPWPRLNAKIAVAIDYQAPSMRQEVIRSQGEKPPRGGAGQPMAGEQRQIQFVSGKYAWNLAGTNANPAPGAVRDRLRQLWMTPHGLIRAATASGARVTSDKSGANVFSLKVEERDVKVTLNKQNLVERAEMWVDSPVLGDVLIETTYSQYADYGGVKFPTRIVEKTDGFPTLDITVREVKPNVAVSLDAPANVRQTPAPPPASPTPSVESQQLADGVWYLSASNYNSTAVEFKDHIVMVDGPVNDARATAVNEFIRKAVPNKPIKYLVNTHHHFDHAGGLRAYVAEGVTIITHEANKPFYEKAWARPRTLNPDRLAKSPRQPIFETMTAKRVLSDETRTLELHHVRDSGHAPGLIMAYLPKERILIYADTYNPLPGDDPRTPALTYEYTQNLYDNVQRLKLDVARLAPVHGRVVPFDNLKKALGL